MTRGDSVICGTTTTGTGTLTLAACPTPPGGIDFDVLCRALGFANSSANIVSYTIIEYTDATFATAKSHEKGFGILTLGASVGIGNCTLARTTKQSSATSLNAQPATQNFMPGTGISIGTAANTLIFIGPSVMDIPASLPYYDTTSNNTVTPVGSVTANTGQSFNPSTHVYNAFDWRIPMLAKRCQVGIWGAASGTTNAYAALYDIGVDGKPGKLLIDFGVLGVPGASLNTGFTSISSAVHSTGFFVMPGEYYFNFRFSCSGTAGTIQTVASNGGERVMTGRLGNVVGYTSLVGLTDTAGVMTPAPDPAYVSGWNTSWGANNNIIFALAPS